MADYMGTSFRRDLEAERRTDLSTSQIQKERNFPPGAPQPFQL